MLIDFQLETCNLAPLPLSTAGMDYNASSANFIFDGDPQEACIRVNITNDDLAEQSESFLVVINTTITSRTVSVNPAYAFVTITDDEGKLALIYCAMWPACIKPRGWYP